MKVRALQSFYGFGGTWQAGDVGQIADPVAKSYAESGLVEIVPDPVPESIVVPPTEQPEKPVKTRMKRPKAPSVESPAPETAPAQ